MNAPPIVLALLFLAASGLSLGCQPTIGDDCRINTDCDVQGTRLCDTSQPDGYCTIYGCNPNKCPGEAACVEFNSGTTRFARTFCLRACSAPSDCRPGYVCISPEDRDAVIIDTASPYKRVCLP